jgi:hypothetical protein
MRRNYKRTHHMLKSTTTLNHKPRDQERKEKYARITYRHECEPVIQMFNIASYVVTWGVMPLLGGGLIIVSNLDKVEWVRSAWVISPFLGGGVRAMGVCLFSSFLLLSTR